VRAPSCAASGDRASDLDLHPWICETKRMVESEDCLLSKLAADPVRTKKHR